MQANDDDDVSSRLWRPKSCHEKFAVANSNQDSRTGGASGLNDYNNAFVKKFMNYGMMHFGHHLSVGCSCFDPPITLKINKAVQSRVT